MVVDSVGELVVESVVVLDSVVESLLILKVV